MKRTVILALAVVASSAFAIKAETIEPVKAAVFRSQGTMFLGMTIWPELNSNWSAYGDVPVEIDYTSLAGNNITLDALQASEADVVILSAPGYLTYKLAEITALKQYVEAGHGLIITYGSFRSQDLWLAPLVGLATTNTYGTGTAIDPLWVEPTCPEHPVFASLQFPYVTGVPYAAYPSYGTKWEMDGGAVIANVRNDVVASMPSIITNETPDYRGLYFSYYIEDASGGSNAQDKQVFYNSLLWAAGLPEPASGLMFLATLAAMLLRRSR